MTPCHCSGRKIVAALKDLSSSLMVGLKNLGPLPISRTLLMNEGFRQASFDIIPEWRIVWVVLEIELVSRKIGVVPAWFPDLVEDRNEEEISDDDSVEVGMKKLESENDCSNSFEVPILGF
ncbi:hypothetical protein Tco_0562108 [Tanacetum coccineum]